MDKRKRWRELSTRQRSSIMVAGVLQVLLAAVALLDLRRRPSYQVKGSKKLWAAAALVNFVARSPTSRSAADPPNQTSLQGVDDTTASQGQRERLTGRQESVSLPRLRSEATWENGG